MNVNTDAIKGDKRNKIIKEHSRGNISFCCKAHRGTSSVYIKDIMHIDPNDIRERGEKG